MSAIEGRGGIARWTLGGAALGAGSALALWLAGAAPGSPGRAPADGGTEPRSSPPPASAAEGGAARQGRAGSQVAERNAVPYRRPPVDPDLGVLGYGRVAAVDGAGVPDARLELEDDEARLYRASTGPTGGWSLAGFPPGPYELRVERDGFLPHAERVAVPAARDWRRDVRLVPAARLPVRFEDEQGVALAMQGFGDLASTLAVVATREPPGRRLPGVTGRLASRSPFGRFLSRAERETPPDLGPRHQGILALEAAPPLFASAVVRDVVLETRSISGAEEELVFVVDPSALEAIRATVRVRLVDRDDGTPITEGVVLQHPSGGLRATPRVEEGELVFEGVPPGTLDLETPASGTWERLERAVDVPPGGALDLGTIALGRRAPFRVRIVDEAGAPVAQDVRLVVARPELASAPGDRGQRMGIRIGADGVAEVAHLAPGPTFVAAGGGDGWALVARMVDTRRETDVELVLRRGTPVVLRRAASARPEIVYVLEDAAGFALLGGSWLPRDLFLASGRYLLRGLEGTREVERVPFAVAQERLVVRYGGSE